MTSAIRDFNSTYLRAVWTLHSSLSLFLACNRKYVEFCDSLCVSCRFIERSSQRGDFGENVAFQTIQYRVQSHRHVLAAALHQSLENKGDNKLYYRCSWQCSVSETVRYQETQRRQHPGLRFVWPLLWRTGASLLLFICASAREKSSENPLDREAHLHTMFPGIGALHACHF